MEKKNILSYGKKCLGETVIDCDGNIGTITGYQIANNGKKAIVQISYPDGTSHWREKFFVSIGSFKKPYFDETEVLLKTGDWKYIHGFEGLYIVSKFGEIRVASGKARGKVKQLQNHTSGYKCVSLYRGSKSSRKLVLVHRVVAEAFLREILHGEQVNHIDGDRANNDISNLEILSREENNQKHIDFRQMGFTDSEIKKMQVICREENLNMKQVIVSLVRRSLE